EAHGVFRGDEVQTPLGLALEGAGGLELFVGGAGFAGVGEAGDEGGERGFAAAQEGGVAVLDGLGAGEDFGLGHAVAGLAGLVDVEQGGAHVVVADLDGAFAHVGHVAVGAGDAAAGVDALAPQFELGVLGLEDLRAGLGMGPVAEALGVVVGLDLFGAQALGPGVGDEFAVALEVVFDVTLGADEGAHFLAGGVEVGFVVAVGFFAAPAFDTGEVGRGLVALGEGADAVEGGGAGDAQVHVSSVEAIDAGAGMGYALRGFVDGHGAEFLEAFLDLGLAVFLARGDAGGDAGLDVGGDVGGVAVEAGGGLLEVGDAFGFELVLEHVGVAAFLAVIDGEGVAGETAFPHGVVVEVLDGG